MTESKKVYSLEDYDWKAAGVFIDDESKNNYLKVLGASIVIFTVLFYISKIIGNIIGNDTF